MNKLNNKKNQLQLLNSIIQLIIIMCLVTIKIIYQMLVNWIQKHKIQKKFNKKKNKEKIHLKKDIVLVLQNQNLQNNLIKIKNYQQNHHKIKKVCHHRI